MHYFSSFSNRKLTCAQQNLVEEWIHEDLQHPNIVEFYHSFVHEESIYIVLELCTNGSLHDLLQVRGCLNPVEVRYIGKDILNGVKYLHQLRVSHNDLTLRT